MIRILTHEIIKNDIKNVETEVADFMTWKTPRVFNIVFVSDVLQLISDKSTFFDMLKCRMHHNSYLILRSPSHRHLEDVKWIHYFKHAIETDKRRTMDTSDIIATLSDRGICLDNIMEVDESEIMSRDDYISLIEERSYSILHIIGDIEFYAGMRNLKQNMAGSSHVQRGQARATDI